MQVNLTLEQQKKEFQMTLSKFSHEIRNPIALIQSELQMLAASHPELSEDDDWYSIMENLEHIRDHVSYTHLTKIQMIAFEYAVAGILCVICIGFRYLDVYKRQL